jgi:hypothetical protein
LCHQEIAGLINVFYFCFNSRGAVGQRAHGLLIHEVSVSHTTHHSRYDSSGRVISSSQRPLPDDIQHSRVTDISPAGFGTTISVWEEPQTYTLNLAATGTGFLL